MNARLVVDMSLHLTIGAEESTNGAVVELESSEDVTITNDEIPEEVLWTRPDTTGVHLIP